MSEETNAGATGEANGTAKPKRPAPEVTKVKMSDGREVDFVGKKMLDKGFTVADGKVTARFDFRNGESRSITVDASDEILLHFAGHGMLQKIGDETAGIKNEDGSPDVDSMVVAVDDLIKRLAGEGSIEDRWYAERGSGDGFSGASVVMKAVLEATNGVRQERGLELVDMAWVKNFLDKKLADGKEAGLTRQKLYASFRAPGSRTAPIIERLEKEKKSKAPAIDANAALEEMAT